MGRPRKKLDKWQRDDAERLKRLFEQSDQSQEAFALQNDLGTQGNVWQYLNGHIPLNLDAALKFAAGLGVTVAAFSPTLAARLAAPIMAREDPDAPLRYALHARFPALWDKDISLIIGYATGLAERRGIEDVTESTSMS